MSRILCVHYSRTGTTRSLAEFSAHRLEELGHSVSEEPLRPRFDLPYPLWLALSFIPGSRAPLSPPLAEPATFDGCLLALPKWTFSCPPVNSFLSSRGASLPRTALLVTCGGWDQDRYLAALAHRIRSLGVPVAGTIALKRRLVCEGTTIARFSDFLAGCFPPEGMISP